MSWKNYSANYIGIRWYSGVCYLKPTISTGCGSNYSLHPLVPTISVVLCYQLLPGPQLLPLINKMFIFQ